MAIASASRRALLLRSGACALVGSLPAACVTTGERGASPPGLSNTLVLIELNGGNDGLNTVIPHGDPLYAKLRPRIGLAADQVVQLDPHTALHPGLAPLLQAWRAGELALVQGLGYDAPNLSHFRSIEIWDSASDSDRLVADGWIARALAPERPLPGRAAEGIVLGRPAAGPLQGARARVAMMQDARSFAVQARRVAMPATSADASAALRHVIATQAELRAAGDAIAARLDLPARAPRTEFPRSAIGRQLDNAARLIAAGIDVPAIKLSHGSFDTHTWQRNTQDRLLAELGAALAAFRAAMLEIGAWRRVVVTTYAEFGRRPAENSAQGTDHGTAAPHLVMGGAVRGGLHGAPPRLDRLDGGGNLRHAVDFRSLYATILHRWWGLDPVPVLGRRWPELELLAA